MVIAFIDDYRDRFGVEPICRVLTKHQVKIAPSTYYAAKSRPPCARAVRDGELLERIRGVHADRAKGRGLAVYRKVWHLLQRDGVQVARCTVQRLMRQDGLHGVVRGRRFLTTRADEAAARPPDLVKRRFTAAAPNRLWCVDFTYVPTWSGVAFTAFVSDVYSRRIVGWRTAGSMPTELPLDASEMALWVRGRDGHYDGAGGRLDGLVHHSDAGTQYTAIRYAARTPARWPRSAPSATPTTTPWPSPSSASIRPSASADGPFRTVDELELATLSWVHWFNQQRLHSSIGHVPPVEHEQAHYRQISARSSRCRENPPSTEPGPVQFELWRQACNCRRFARAGAGAAWTASSASTLGS